MVYACSGSAEIGRQHPCVDSGAAEGGAPAALDVAAVEQLVIAGRGEPAVAAQFLLELSGAPAGIAQSRQPVGGAPPLGDGPEDVEGRREAPAAGHLDRLVAAPVGRVENEAALRLDRAPGMDRHVGRDSGLDVELAEQFVK